MSEVHVNNAVSPVGDGFGGVPRWGKIAIVGVLAAGAIAAIVLPGFWGAGSGRNEHGNGRPTASGDPKVYEGLGPPGKEQAAFHPGATTNNQQTQQRAVHRRAPMPTQIALYGVTESPSRRSNGSQESPGQTEKNSDELLYGSDDLGRQLSGATTLATSHAVMTHHPSYMVASDQSIPCNLVDAINSSGGGTFITCSTREDVRDEDERRILIPAGSKLTGQIRNGMQAGQSRLQVAFTRIRTSGDNFRIQFTGPGTDALGRAGVEGELNTFFWETAGATALYALIDAAQGAIVGGAQAALNSALSSGEGNNNNFLNLNLNGGGAGSHSLAQTALQSRINRPPELNVRPGTPISISLGQDLDFYKACRARMEINPYACPLLAEAR